MTSLIGSALKALFDEGAASKSLVATIGQLVRRKPITLTEVRDAVDGDAARPVFRWEISFDSKHDLMRFDSAIISAAEAAYKEEA